MGLLSGIAGVIGPQPPSGSTFSPGNLFEGQYIIPSGLHAGQGYFPNAATHTVTSDGGFYPFKYYSNLSALLQDPYPNTTSGGIAFVPTTSSYNPATCPSTCVSLNLNDEGDPEDDIEHDEDIAMESFPSGSEVEAMNWQMKKDLYKKLDENQYLLNSSEILSNYYDTTQNSCISYFVDLDQQLNLFSDTTNEDLNDSAYVQNIVEDAISINNNVVPNNIVEENEKTINDIYLATIASGNLTFTLQQINSVELIANQCPFIGGNSVYRARGLEMLWNDSVDFNDDFLCSEMTSRFSNRKDFKPIIAQVRPNPSTGVFMLDFDLGNNSDPFYIEITNLFGVNIYNKRLMNSSGNVMLDLDQFNSGLYHYTITGNGIVLKTGKIAIVK